MSEQNQPEKEEKQKAIKVLLPEHFNEVHLETPEHILFFLIFRAIEEQTQIMEKQNSEILEAIQRLTEVIEKKKGK